MAAIQLTLLQLQQLHQELYDQESTMTTGFIKSYLPFPLLWLKASLIICTTTDLDFAYGESQTDIIVLHKLVCKLL